MKVESRVLSSIKHRPGAVVLRRELAGLGSASQISEALKALRAQGVIVRVSEGIYAKSVKDPLTGAVTPMAPAEQIAREAFRKLIGAEVSVEPSQSLNDLESLVVDTGAHRITRKLVIGNKAVRYAGKRESKRGIAPASRLNIPKEGVSQFVAHMARQHGITYARTAGDAWAETVTRLAGDDVRPDSTGDLLVALKRANKLTDQEMTALLVNHLREQRGVRSV